MTLICCGVLYYGWPVIEAILILLPIPDPKDIKAKIVELWNQAKGLVGAKDKPDSS